MRRSSVRVQQVQAREISQFSVCLNLSSSQGLLIRENYMFHRQRAGHLKMADFYMAFHL